MIYVFTFLGEFGYEILNWQGVVRKFSRTTGTSDVIVCCSRRGLQPFYEKADHYIDISEVELFRSSLACAYYALASPVYDFKSRSNILYARRLKRVLRRFILGQLRKAGLIDTSHSEECLFVFSCDKTVLNDCAFGVRESPYDPEYDIYDYLDLKNNVFKKIEPDLGCRGAIEARLGWSLAEPYILCQTRKRSLRIPTGSFDSIPSEKIIEELAKYINVVLLSFQTGRCLDSASAWGGLDRAFAFNCRTFTEQACLIHFSQACLFFTEGDFGSHIYLPPMLGHDVFAVAPWTVYQLGTSPIEFWNRKVFRFGGSIVPLVSEDLFASQQELARTVADLLSPVHSEVPRRIADTGRRTD